MRQLAGIAGLAYVAGAAVENMRLLEAPTLDSGAGAVREAFADQALAVVTTSAGAVSLVAYAVFAVALTSWVGGSKAALVGGLGGPLLAAAALVATATLVASADSRTDTTVLDVFAVSQELRLASGAFMALFLVGIATAARRDDRLPRPLTAAALAVAPLTLLGPAAAITGDATLEAAAKVAFGLQSLWIVATSGWLVLAADDAPLVTQVRRGAFALLAVAAGLVGLGMLAAPASTGDFFAWVLAPDALAAFAGGVYVGSAVAYAAALPRPDAEVRGYVLGAVVLSTSVLTITLTHLGPFDFGRLQAWAWVVLFAGFSAVTIWLYLAIPPDPPPAGDEAGPEVRAALVLVAVGAAIGAAALWLDPVSLELPPLGGRFAGAWVALLATISAHAAVRGSAAEARLAATALLALPLGALAAAVRTGADPLVVGSSLLLLAAGCAVLAGLRRSPATAAT